MMGSRSGQVFSWCILFAVLKSCTCESDVKNEIQEAWFSGLNTPWNQFGYDIGTDAYDADYFETFFQYAQSNQQNAARFWVHCDGRKSPLFDNNGYITGLSDSFMPNLIDMVTRASQHNVVLQLCMWSFDMCTDETFPRDSAISNSSITQSYIDNALVPILDGLITNGLDKYVLIEVINEPEWCMQGSCTTTDCVEVEDMQRFVGMQAAAIHSKGLKVTVGSASLKWNSNSGSAVANYWSDSALISATGGDSSAHLDLYNIHYYDWMYDASWGYDPCRANVSYWGLDKPTVVAELPADSIHYTATEMIECAFNNGFYGDMFWAYNGGSDFPVTDAINPMIDFAEEYPSLVSYTNLLSFIEES